LLPLACVYVLVHSLQRALMGLAILAVYGCGEMPQPSESVSSPLVETPSPTPVVETVHGPLALIGTIEPLDCATRVESIIDYADGSGGAPDIVAATMRMEEFKLRPDDQIVVDGERTAIIRDGKTVLIANWFRADGGGWLLGGTSTCEGFLPDG
jgi:hypothetical protein